MNHLLGKSLQNDRKHSYNNLLEATKENDVSHPSCTNNELSESIRKLSASFHEKLQRISNEEVESNQSSTLPSIPSSLLLECNEERLVFNKSALNSFMYLVSRVNFFSLLLAPSNDFSLHFSPSHEGNQPEELKQTFTDPFGQFASNSKMSLYDELLLSKDCNLSKTPLSFMDNNQLPISPKELLPLNTNDVLGYNANTISTKPLPKYLTKKRGFSIDYSGDDHSSTSDRKQSKSKQNDSSGSTSHEKQYKSIKKTHADKSFTCELCSAVFDSPQGLGGHMSRTHKDQSSKFKKKKEIRESRTFIRDLREDAKKRLCEEHNEDYNLLVQSKEGKGIIKKLVNQNEKQFKKIKEMLMKKPCK